MRKLELLILMGVSSHPSLYLQEICELVALVGLLQIAFFSQFKQMGKVTPIEQPDLESMRKLELLILVAVSFHPSLYLQELCKLVRTATGVSVSGSTVCRLLQRNGFTRKKVQQVAKQRCTDYRAAYMAHILQFPKECLVFLDETNCAAKD